MFTHAARAIRRVGHHEWWPAWVLYTLLLPHFLRLAVRHRSLTCWTCTNPGFGAGGGIIGESKQAILDGFAGDPRVLVQRVLGADQPDKTRRAIAAVRTDTALGGFPLIVKPDAGQRGTGVHIARSEAELVSAIHAMPGRVALQRYHPGPVEIGVFWVRDIGTVGAEREDTRQGRIFALTRKTFPVVEGDGSSTIRELVQAHPRFSMQARVYLEQLGPAAERTPGAGETVTLTATGNHSRGCRFEDGADLLTPELEDTIDSLARRWRGPGGEPFDFGRFDLRAATEEDAKAARGIGVIELNGVTSEATNLYDPSWSARRALRLLARQWTLAFEIGAARKRAGVRPLGILGLARTIRPPRPPAASRPPPL